MSKYDELQELVDTPDAIGGIIRNFCKRHGVAESTFGRLSVNDGKLMSRIDAGSRIEPVTARRVAEYMKRADNGEIRLRGRPRRNKQHSAAETMADLISRETSVRTPGSFAFHEQRQRFHVFAATTNESWVLADRVADELRGLTPGPEGIRIFYAPMDNGITLTRMLRALHAHFPGYSRAGRPQGPGSGGPAQHTWQAGRPHSRASIVGFCTDQSLHARGTGPGQTVSGQS